MTKYLICLIGSMCSFSVLADDPENCNSNAPHIKTYSRDISHAKFAEDVNIKEIVKSILLEHVEEIERKANWTREYSGPDGAYIPLLISLLDENAGMHHELSCIWELYKEGDILRRFTDNEPMVFRKGYALFRDEELIAYFYSQIAVV